MQKIVPNLWFDQNAEEAVRFYVSVFKNSKMEAISRYGKEGFEIHHMPEGTVMTMAFEIEGQSFLALNGGPVFKFNEAVSFIVNCKDQKEVDYYWNCLSEGGDEASQICGWLKDKYGVSWQVVPQQLGQMLSDKDKAKAGRVMAALLQMKKLDVTKLQKAYSEKK